MNIRAGTAGDGPRRTATFLFTDIEGSTLLLENVGQRYVRLIEAHRRLIRKAIARYGGLEHDADGDAFFIIFASARAGLDAAVAIQQALDEYEWPHDASVRVRIGVHTGEASVAGDKYYGLEVHRAARICGAAHGGQTLLSSTTAALVRSNLPTRVHLRDLGEHRFKDLGQPERVFQADIEDLRGEFPPLRALPLVVNNLPIQRTSFIGRERELNIARSLLGKTRLLSLTGPGGTGKTRLALQISAEAARNSLMASTSSNLRPCATLPWWPHRSLRRWGSRMTGAGRSLTLLLSSWATSA